MDANLDNRCLIRLFDIYHPIIKDYKNVPYANCSMILKKLLQHQ